jgi:hypothetical protein
MCDRSHLKHPPISRRLIRLSNAALTDEFDAAWKAWRGDEMGEARLDRLDAEISRRERLGLLCDDDWRIVTALNRIPSL